MIAYYQSSLQFLMPFQRFGIDMWHGGIRRKVERENNVFIQMTPLKGLGYISRFRYACHDSELTVCSTSLASYD